MLTKNEKQLLIEALRHYKDESKGDDTQKKVIQNLINKVHKQDTIEDTIGRLNESEVKLNEENN